jgi:predicted HicB family RNase H-like nuclease
MAATVIMVRLDPRLKRKVQEEAKAKGLSMSAWIRLKLTEAMADGKR